MFGDGQAHLGFTWTLALLAALVIQAVFSVASNQARVIDKVTVEFVVVVAVG